MAIFRVVVLASGTGTLFTALANQADQIGIQIVGLISEAEVPACERARELGIPVTIVPLLEDRIKWDQNLATELSRLKPSLIVSAGFMKILGPVVLRFHQGKIINTHPALLPDFQEHMQCEMRLLLEFLKPAPLFTSLTRVSIRVK